MTFFDKKTTLLLEINGRVNRLMDNAGDRTSNKVRELENYVHELRMLYETDERRKWQAEALKLPGAEPVKWLGEIGHFVSDLIFHARDLGRNVRGEFNGIPLEASPSTQETYLIETYHRQFNARRARGGT